MSEIRDRAQKLLNTCIAVLTEPDWKEYGRLSVKGEWSQGDEQEMLDAMLSLDEALRLLPPEGETRKHGFDAIREVACNIVGGCMADISEEEKIEYADERIRTLFPAPAPSAEKALREAYEQGLANMSANFPAAKEVIIDKVIDTIYKWSNEHEHQVTPPYDWAELGKRLRLLASPSPQGEDAGLREAVELIRAFIDETKAEGAQENHKQRALAYLITIEDYANKLRARLASSQSSAQGEEAREIVAARDEEWKAWIKAKGFDLEPLAGCP